MIKVIGTLKRDQNREYTTKEGQSGSSRELFIFDNDSEREMYPVKVNVADKDLKIGKIGDKVELDVEIFPYYIVNGKRKRAFVDIYIPKQKK